MRPVSRVQISSRVLSVTFRRIRLLRYTARGVVVKWIFYGGETTPHIECVTGRSLLIRRHPANKTRPGAVIERGPLSHPFIPSSPAAIHALKSWDSPHGSSRDSFYLRPWNSYRRGFRGRIVVPTQPNPSPPRGAKKFARLHYMKWRIQSTSTAVSWSRNEIVIVSRRVRYSSSHDVNSLGWGKNKTITSRCFFSSKLFHKLSGTTYVLCYFLLKARCSSVQDVRVIVQHVLTRSRLEFPTRSF